MKTKFRCSCCDKLKKEKGVFRKWVYGEPDKVTVCIDCDYAMKKLKIKYVLDAINARGE